jgi:hypothetical protein
MHERKTNGRVKSEIQEWLADETRHLGTCELSAIANAADDALAELGLVP